MSTSPDIAPKPSKSFLPYSASQTRKRSTRFETPPLFTAQSTQVNQQTDAFQTRLKQCAASNALDSDA